MTLKPILDGNTLTGSHWHSSWHSEIHRPLVTIDFDHTITKTCPACSEWRGIYELQEGVKEAIVELAKQFEIVILTGGGTYRDDYAKVVEGVLRQAGIPFDRIEAKKPPAVFMIDDRAIRHEGWTSTMKEIRRRMAIQFRLNRL